LHQYFELCIYVSLKSSPEEYPQQLKQGCCNYYYHNLTRGVSDSGVSDFVQNLYADSTPNAFHESPPIWAYIPNNLNNRAH
jgi:hypothetical protein